MKTELKEILENDDAEKLEKYLQENKSIDYSFFLKLGDDKVSVNPILYSLTKQLKSTDVFFNCLSNSEIEKFLKQDPHLRESILLRELSNPSSKANSKILNTIYHSLSENEKRSFSTIVMINPYIPNDRKEMFLMDDDKLKSYIQKDDAENLLTYLEKNPQCFQKSKKNFLKECIEHQAVFCFDIVKDHMKSMKLEVKKTIKKQM